MTAKMSTTSTALILSGNAYENFVNTIKSDATLDIYVFAIKRYLSHLNSTDIDELLRFDQSTIQSQMINYILVLK